MGGAWFFGVLLVARPNPSPFDAAAWLPIASALAWASAMILTRLVAPTDSASTTQTYACAVALSVLSAALLPMGFVIPSGEQFVELAATGASWTVAQWLVVRAYSRAEASHVAPFAYTQLLWAHLLSLSLLQQRPDNMTLMGSAVIALAGIGAARVGAHN